MPTYTPLQSIVLTSDTASVTFSGISQNYQDLIIVTNVKSTSTGNVIMRFNSDSSALYSRTVLSGNGSSAQTDRNTGFNEIYTDYNGYFDGSNFNQIKNINIMNYSNTTTFKTCLIRSSRAQSGTYVIVGLYRSTNAITSILLSGNGLNFAAGSTFDLYAISPVAANTAQAFGGTEIIYTNTHVIHVFKASGTFTPYRNLTADYLVVAGGGAGGGGANGAGGGGGAGGLRSTVTVTGDYGGSLESALSLTANTAYTVIIGAGGGATNNGRVNGSNSSILGTGITTITSTGGGGGGSRGSSVDAGGNGGSGGGASGSDSNSGGGTRTSSPVQGYNGGSGGGGGANNGGGGGGAGAIGSAGTGSAAGAGGAGVAVSITGSSVSYAGGGAGGAQVGTTGSSGGTGGGGAGGGSNNSYLGTAGTTNTGGGGGAQGNIVTSIGANGGSGIVIIRYAR